MSEQQPNIDKTHAEADEFGQLTGHNYDGIQEYDNPTPSWWTWVFIASVLFAPFYMFLILVSGGDLSPNALYERAAIANMERKFGTIGELEPNEETLVKFMHDQEWMAYGRNVYLANGCNTCHGNNAEGNTGPNLTDNHFININKIEDIATIINEGAAGGNMPAWANRMHPNDVALVSSYIATLRGTNAPGGKAPEGEEIPDWPEYEGSEDKAPDQEIQTSARLD